MSETTLHAIDRWSGGACPFEAGWRKVMMWSFIVTDGLLFAGFLASYGYARAMSAAWPDQAAVFALPFITLMTFVLITSSATMASAVWAAQHDRRGLAAPLRLADAPRRPRLPRHAGVRMGDADRRRGEPSAPIPGANPLFGAYFFVTTGFHGAHVLTGVVVLLVVGSRARRRPHPDGQRRDGRPVLALRRFWCGVFIFTLFYLV